MYVLQILTLILSHIPLVILVKKVPSFAFYSNFLGNFSLKDSRAHP